MVLVKMCCFHFLKMIAVIVWTLWHRQNFEVKTLTKGNNSKNKGGRVLALFHNVFSHCIKFQGDNFHSLEDKAQTKIESQK